MDSQDVMHGVGFETKQSADRRCEHHRRRPQLARTATSEWLKELTREQLCYGAEVLRKCHVGVLHQVGIAGKRTACAVFGERSPACVQRPDRSLVIAHWIVD